MSKYTFGPWRYEYQNGYCGEIISSNGKIVATFTDEPTAQDARLIAAAPSLLEALERIADVLPDRLDHSIDVAIIERCAAFARAAIEKAIKEQK